MSWQKVEGQDRFRRSDGAIAHRLAGDTWIAKLPARKGLRQLALPALCGGGMRKFDGAAAAMAEIDTLAPL